MVGLGMIRPSERARSNRPRQVLIVGGGVAGLEALLALHDLAGERRARLGRPPARLRLQALLVEEPFDLGPASSAMNSSRSPASTAEFIRGAIAAVRPNEHEVELDDGTTRGYDYLLVAAGEVQAGARDGDHLPLGGRAVRQIGSSIAPRRAIIGSRSSSQAARAGRCPSTRSR